VQTMLATDNPRIHVY